MHDALACGFGSIEADIHLVEGRLLVAHDRKSVKLERTLEMLYLDPLRERTKQNGGRVYRQGPTVTLLVDVKTAAVATYRVPAPIVKSCISGDFDLTFAQVSIFLETSSNFFEKKMTTSALCGRSR